MLSLRFAVIWFVFYSFEVWAMEMKTGHVTGSAQRVWFSRGQIIPAAEHSIGCRKLHRLMHGNLWEIIARQVVVVGHSVLLWLVQHLIHVDESGWEKRTFSLCFLFLCLSMSIKVTFAQIPTQRNYCWNSRCSSSSNCCVSNVSAMAASVARYPIRWSIHSPAPPL